MIGSISYSYSMYNFAILINPHPSVYVTSGESGKVCAITIIHLRCKKTLLLLHKHMQSPPLTPMHQCYQAKIIGYRYKGIFYFKIFNIIFLHVSITVQIIYKFNLYNYFNEFVLIRFFTKKFRDMVLKHFTNSVQPQGKFKCLCFKQNHHSG